MPRVVAPAPESLASAAMWSRSVRALAVPVIALLFAVPLVWTVLPGGAAPDLEVHPAGTGSAHPATTVSLRGRLRYAPDVTVSGARSGAHTGDLRRHADGAGYTFVPDAPFVPGEQVTVRVDDRPFTFGVAVPGDIPDRWTAEDGIADVEPARASFVSEPDLVAPVVTTSGRPVPDLLLTTPRATRSTPASAMITDARGEPVWLRTADDPAISFGNLHTARLDGQPVLVWYEGRDPDGPGFYEGEWVVVDRSYAQVARIPAANGMQADIHDIDLTGRGTAWIMSYHPVVRDMSAHGGGPDTVVLEAVLQEVDVRTGDVHHEWHSLDHVPVEWSHQPIRDDDVFDYFHINSAVESPDGDLLVSARHTSMVAEIDRATGVLAWVLGGDGATLDVGEDRGISFPHHARWRSDGRLSVFDNGVEFDPPTSRGVVYEVDEDAGGARVTGEYATDPRVYTATQGSLQHLGDGGALAAWSEEARITLFDAAAAPVGDVDLGAPTYRAFSAAWVGTPAQPPSVAVRDGRVHVSWNGATEVAAWRLHVGDSAATLQAAGDTPRSGFETVLDRPVMAGLTVVVTALDAAGDTLATSAPVVAGG